MFPARDELLAAVAEQQAAFAPETKYRYSNLGMALLGEVVAVASETPYAEYLKANVFEPLSMSDSTAVPTQEERSRLAVGYMRPRDDRSRGVFEYYDTGALAPAANIVSTLEDMVRFAALQFRDELPAAGPVLAGSTLREMQRVQWLKPGWSSGRGLGFGVSQRDGKTVVSHGGWIAGNRSHLLLVPSEKIAVVAMVNADDGQPHVFGYEAYDTMAPDLASASDSSAAATDPAPVDVGPDLETSDWEPYFGLYADPWEWEYRVLELDGDLILYSYSYPPASGARDGVTRLEPVGAAELGLAASPSGTGFAILARPKSRILMRPSLVTNRLPGLRSR